MVLMLCHPGAKLGVKQERRLLLEGRYLDPVLSAQLQFFVVGNAFRTVMKQACNQCLGQVCTVSHGEAGCSVHNADGMLISGFVQLVFQFLFYLILYIYLSHQLTLIKLPYLFLFEKYNLIF